MAVTTEVVLSPVTLGDVQRVGRFLHEHLNGRLTPAAWATAMVPPWHDGAPNHGFMLTVGSEVAGVNLAFYASQVVDGRTERFCNLAALCVREDARPHTFRLVRALLRQPGYHFTDLSPSGSVVELDRRLGLRPLDTTTALAPNLPLPVARDIRLVTDPERMEELLGEGDRTIFRDHRHALAARQLLLVRGDRYCHLVYRRDRRKRLPLFASLLHVSDVELYRAGAGLVGRHLLRQGLPLTLVELRLLGHRPPPRAQVLRTARPKMVKSTLDPDRIDYLYSELTCVPW
jgi:hypothetical protein